MSENIEGAMDGKENADRLDVRLGIARKPPLPQFDAHYSITVAKNALGLSLELTM